MLLLISLLSFLLPFQLAHHFNSFPSAVYGFKIDYLIPTLYLTDIFAFLIILKGLENIKLKKNNFVVFLLFLTFVVINVLISANITASLYRWIKILEMILLGIVIFKTKKFKVYNHFLKPLSYSVVLSTVLGILQFLNKGSLGSIFYWLGERSFNFTDPNIAPYPYATFSHPNSFAGFLLVFGILIIQYRKKFNLKYFWLLVSLIFTNLILTNSLNVYITVVLILLLKYYKKLSLGLFVIDFNQRFISHRIELIQASLKIIKDHFMLGVGLNNFIPNLVKVSNKFINAWELQPVHNIFLLVFSETGIIGLSLFMYLIISSVTVTNYGLIAILLTGLSDHYWITLQQNLLLFTYVMVISKKQ